MKTTIQAVIESRQNGFVDRFEGTILLTRANADLLKVVAKRTLALDSIRRNADIESLTANDFGFGAVVFLGGVAATLAVRQVHIYCGSGMDCPSVVFQGAAVSIKPVLNKALLEELANSEPIDVALLDTEVSCEHCGAVEVRATRDNFPRCNFCGHPHATESVAVPA